MPSSIAALMSVVMAVIAMAFCYFVIGWGIVVPILEHFIDARRLSGESVGVVEAVVAFVVVMSYMLLTTILVTFCALSGWITRRLWNTRSLNWSGFVALFKVHQPN